MSLKCVWRQLRKESKDKMTKAIEDRIIRVIRNLFEEENYWKSIRVSKFWSKNCIECENYGGRNKIPSTKEYINEIKPYLKDQK